MSPPAEGQAPAKRRRRRRAADDPVAAPEDAAPTPAPRRRKAAKAKPAEPEPERTAPDPDAPEAGAEAAPAAPGRLSRAWAALRHAARRAWVERGAPPLAPRSGGAPAAAFLCAFVAALALAAGVAGERLSRAWTAEFGQAATLVAFGPPEAAERDFKAALEVLDTTPGIASVRVLEAPERRALLAPWLGPGQAAPVEPPPMAAVRLSGAGPDPRMLALRLAEEAPGAAFDDHSGWRGPLQSAADDARRIGWGAAGLAGGLGALLCALIAGAWTARARDDQRLLRRMGAERAQLRRAWAGRAGWRAFLGGALGAGLAAAALAGPELAWGPAARLPIAPAGWDWLALAAPAPLLALAAWAGARLALRPALRGDAGPA
ncbi:hypothetical protein P2H44_13115 [Albimonas sp. CAU 1670]|uniref:FtsX-like permease family protein n=1 Tax=Albimonas sp. CAU 1670 TaxID=3032599 RepID=UPI0023DA8E9E|nr:FtsX-like permease family protein [Albimonas sp. CAU 1670]MDF2233494.1 hypothetical protein [Albimonas sp. CAU 1670]